VRANGGSPEFAPPFLQIDWLPYFAHKSENGLAFIS
jgi:hypothetical protein